MISSAVEALYIYDQDDVPIFEHVYCSRPPSATILIRHYIAHAEPRPSIIHCPDTIPQSVVFAIKYGLVLLLAPVSRDTDTFVILEFLNRVVDVLEEFLGAPLLPSKIESSYDVIAQLVGELCDTGLINETEPNVIRQNVEVAGWMGKFLQDVGLPSTSSVSSAPRLATASLQAINHAANAGPAVPWRRPNIRHTSNEMYVDMVETLQITLAPSGHPLAAFAHGSILFDARISGVPDILLTLTCPEGVSRVGQLMELPCFHPCIRLSRWQDQPGEMSFIPPDGKCVLASYEVDLMPKNLDVEDWLAVDLDIPVGVDLNTSLVDPENSFEVMVWLKSGWIPETMHARSGNQSSLQHPPSVPSRTQAGIQNVRPRPIRRGPEQILISVPLPRAVCRVTTLRASRGEAFHMSLNSSIEWRILTKDLMGGGAAKLHCSVGASKSFFEYIAPQTSLASATTLNQSSTSYDEAKDGEHPTPTSSKAKEAATEQPPSSTENTQVSDASLMPSAATISFSIKDWLASGLKVDKLELDPRRSHGLKEGIKPFKGVKYLTLSKEGIEIRS